MTEGYKSTPIDLTAAERAALADAGSKTDALIARSEEVFGRVQTPVEGSLIALAHVSDLRDAYDNAGLLVFSAQDHLQTIHRILVSGPLPTYALYTLVRAAAEADVRAYHLLAPGIAESDRLARGLNERFDSIREQEKVRRLLQERGKAPPIDPTYSASARIAHLENRAAANGIATLREKRKDGSPGVPRTRPARAPRRPVPRRDRERR